MHSLARRTILFGSFFVGVVAVAQVTLSGTSYTENFNSIDGGLPAGWSVYTNATATSNGTASTFTSGVTAWNSTASGSSFRNIASDDIASSATSTTQNISTNRALGWRPLTAGARDGAIVFDIQNTTGFTNFSLSVNVFTGNNTGSTNQTYSLEYRIGSSGSFTSLASYTTTAPFGSITLTADSVALSAIANQSSGVSFRFRNASGTSDTSYDTFGIDNFSLTYSAIPEPSTYAALLGIAALGGVMWHRRRKARLAV